ncbi:sporulation protein SsgA [Streptomyces daqingensis]|uniref:Sporulation protein SsgA n=1 Tax=Streptomyces daqingensis TaxID=1472640 RepID=A0ABQ2MPQ7_9ACTN|nr:plasmid transfer protein TraB [Streptomyces daqingensis]GGO55399.1 sporulation protein SsgA [Streptomyces daqingensis]
MTNSTKSALKSDVRKGLSSPHARPWLAAAAQVPATFAAHQAWGNEPLVAMGMTLAAGALTAATWWAGKNTSEARRLHATLTTAAATGYLTVASFTDPLGDSQLTWLAIGGSALAASWNVRKVLRVNPDAAKGEGEETGILTKSLGKAKARLRGEPKVEPNKVTAKYQLAPGELTNADLGNRINQIASELGISPNSIRIQPDAENAAQGEMVFVPTDMLKTPTAWPGPSHPGGSITDPVQPGIYEDGAPAELWFPADQDSGRNATHFLTAGMNGSGKSAGVSIAVAEVLTRRDVIVWAVDPSKGKQTFAPFLPYLDWVEMTTAGGEAMIDALSPVITARADALGEHGYKNWTPDAYRQLGMPYMVVWIEEAAKFFREGTEMEGLVMEARSAGISVIISLQRPSATSMPTDVREQLGGVMCFGVKGGTTADMALPEDVRDAGARPEAWENRKPGYAYLVAPGVDEDRYATPLRTYYTDDQQIEAVLASVPRPAADPVTATAAGEAYAERTHYTDDTTREMPVHTDERAGQDEVLLERQINRDIDARLPSDDDGSGPSVEQLNADPDREIPPVSVSEVWAFAKPAPTPEKSPEEAYSELLAMLEEYRRDGLEHVGPKHFQPYGREGRIGRSRAWISARLNELADEEIHLAETDDAGVYTLLYPTLAAAS